MNFAELPPLFSLAVFLLAALVIGLAGSRLSAAAAQLADATSLGEAVVGALLLGGATSLPGIVVSVTSAWEGRAELSASNAIGGIAAQTFFLAVADMFHRGANLEHAAASEETILQGTGLISLLAIPLLATFTPPFQLLGVHPATPLLFAAYVYAMHLVAESHGRPMWKPVQTKSTRSDQPSDATRIRKMPCLIQFIVYGSIVAFAGWTTLRTAVSLSATFGISDTVTGGLFTAVATSLPELVTSVAAVRQGALTLAVGGIIGGNAFDTLFLAFADVAYREGSLYHALSSHQLYLIALTILMTGVLLMGLVRRQEKGIANIGFESFFIVVIYAGAMVLLVLV